MNNTYEGKTRNSDIKSLHEYKTPQEVNDTEGDDIIATYHPYPYSSDEYGDCDQKIAVEKITAGTYDYKLVYEVAGDRLSQFGFADGDIAGYLNHVSGNLYKGKIKWKYVEPEREEWEDLTTYLTTRLIKPEGSDEYINVSFLFNSGTHHCGNMIYPEIAPFERIDAPLDGINTL